MLGKQVYDRMLGEKEETAVPTTWRYRFVRGEVVGKPLERGQGKVDLQRANKDPTMCLHPDASMVSRGNKESSKWWLCKDCVSRWERLPSNYLAALNSVAQERTPLDRDLHLLTWGKHAGTTYQEVFHTDPSYVKWVLETATHEKEVTSNFTHLVEYFQAKALQETFEQDGTHVPVEEYDLMEDDALL
jgi:hypothetical protein